MMNRPAYSSEESSFLSRAVKTTYLLCMEFEGPWCMEGPLSFLFMPGGGHMPDPTWGGMLPMLEPMLELMLGP